MGIVFLEVVLQCGMSELGGFILLDRPVVHVRTRRDWKAVGNPETLEVLTSLRSTIEQFFAGRDIDSVLGELDGLSNLVRISPELVLRVPTAATLLADQLSVLLLT